MTKQDSITLNISKGLRSMYRFSNAPAVLRKPRDSPKQQDAFGILLENGILTRELAFKLKAMVGFRNIAVHDYQSINLNILRRIIEDYLRDI